MVRWLFCTHTHTHTLAPLRTHSVSLKVQAFCFPSAENVFESCKWKVNAKTCYNYLRTARISPRELCFQGSSQIGCFSSEWTVRVGYPVLPGAPVNTELTHLWLQSHAHHWHKTWKAKLFVARVYYSGTFFRPVSHRSIMLNSRDLTDLKILRRGRPLERVFLITGTWTHVMAEKRDSRGHSTTSFSWKFYDFAIGRGLNFLQ